MLFSGNVAIITGGNRGIGYAAAKRFRAEGASVVLVGRDSQVGQKAAAELQASFVQGDVRLAGDCERVISQAMETYGKLNALVNSAGIILRNKTVEQTGEEDWDALFDTNVKGTYLMCKYAMPFLKQVQGTVVNVSSYAGLVGFKGAAAYSASKAAVVNLTRAMALDHAADNVRVNCVCPGSVLTDMLTEAWETYGNVEEARRLWTEKHPLGRIAGPDEIASVIAFLCSDEASFITGAALPVDGGITAG